MTSSGGFSWAFRIGSIRGMDLRLHLTLLLLIGYWLIEGAYYGGTSGLVRAAQLTGTLFGVIIWHELGHAWAARRSGLRVDGILLWPLGGECQIAERMPTPRTEIFVALAGPAAHLLLVAVTFLPLVAVFGLPGWDIFRLMGNHNGFVAAWALALWIMIFNIIPAFPLDGGLALRGMLAMRLGEVRATRIAARLGQAIAAVYLVIGLWQSNMLLIALAIYVIAGAEQELRAVLATGGAYDASPRDPFFRSLGIREDWAKEAADRSERAEKAGLWTRMKVRWQLWKLTRATERHERLRKEVDRILDKVNREGMTALTRREKKILKQASREYRESR